MEIVKDRQKIRALTAEYTAGGLSVGFVPTMGALHEGHLSLVDAARKENDLACVSIFVNPTQFAAGEDFSRYPRTLENDLELLKAKADLVFIPSADEMYPRPAQTSVSLPELGVKWEGAVRPTHFAGVALVVLKLFNLVKPRRAYFGRKDFQQTVIVRRLVEDLNIDVELRVMDTVREADGLAMSSRNRFLSLEARRHAPRLYQTLLEFLHLVQESGDVRFAREKALAFLLQAPFHPDYLALVDDDTLDEVLSPRPSQKYTAIVAARLDGVRLIDNLPFDYRPG